MEINILVKRINNATAERDEQKKRLSQKSTEHDEREAFCDDEGLQYGERRQERDHERNILSEVIGIIEGQMLALKKYIGDRAQA